ncbi:MAG: DHA2 family efflux MFS transporter permease subunit [Rhodomicrobiaceae bacterium]
MTTRDVPYAGAAPPLATWIAFSAMCLGMFMAVLDIQIVATSLPTIQEALGIRQDQMSWVQTSYLIAEVVAIPLTGLLTRSLTMRWLAVATLAAFTVASVGCAMSGSFVELLAWRVVQGFAGGLLIPQVFAAGFVLFPDRGQASATTIAGVLAVLAPAIGPYIGGWITSTYDWPWLFLINTGPGVVAAAIAATLLPHERPDLGALRDLDLPALALMAIALACLEIGLKEAPLAGWAAFHVTGLFAASLAAGTLFVARSLTSARPVVDLRTLGRRDFALGATLSFILGVGLYGSVYLMPVFLAFVRNHDALEIGQTVVVTGAAQLAMAPIAIFLERYTSARALTALGFGIFAAGLALSAFETRATDFATMFGPQVIRGIAIMLCLLPPIRLALGGLPQEAIANASGLFNLMRNLGGAIGLALIDTVIYGRAPVIGDGLGQALAHGDVEAAKTVGLPMAKFLAHVPGTPVDPSVEAYVRAAVERQALTQAINEAWALVALLTLAGALAVCFVRSGANSARATERRD